MTSTRLPGKVLKEVLSKPLLEYEIDRLKRVKNTDLIVLATTTNREDDKVASLGQRLGVSVYRGSEEDVLSRYYEAAQSVGADVIVRLTADCPILDPTITEELLQFYLDHQAACDYVRLEGYPRGLDGEVFSFALLAEAANKAKDQPDREHVTPYFYRYGLFRIGEVRSAKDLTYHRWTVDTPEDFSLIENIIEALYPVKPNFTYEDVLTLLEEHPAWVKLNAEVVQKKLGE